jgi:glycosyltransferase involved in cell wall biosynthesis
MTSHSLSYAIITPTRNEAENLRRLADCLVAQTLRPADWVIVDNGSTDDTIAIAHELTRAHDWIKLEIVDGSRKMMRGAPIVKAFHRGLDFVNGRETDVVVKLDADVSFAPDFFERLLDEFAADPRLGIAGGLCLEQVQGRWTPQHGARSHVRGATRAYRFECLREVLPLEERMGWDGVDELKAGVRGWGVRSLPDVSFYHHRSLAQREGAWGAWFAQGEMAHFMGYRAHYLLFRALFRMRRQPSAVAMVLGFISASAKRSTVLDDADARRYLRDQQRLRHVPRRLREASGRVL